MSTLIIKVIAACIRVIFGSEPKHLEPSLRVCTNRPAKKFVLHESHSLHACDHTLVRHRFTNSLIRLWLLELFDKLWTIIAV